MAGYQPRIGTDHVWFNGTDVHDWSLTTQLGVRVTEMRGWDERPDIRDVRELRSGQDGEYADNLYLGGRTITISGEVYGSSWVDLQARKRALAAVFTPTSSEVLLKVPDPATASPTGVYATTGMTGYERASVRVIEPLTFGDMIGSFGMRWQVSLRASDPRIYSDVETSTDSGTSGTAARTVTVDQAGTYETPTTITVTGTTGSSWSIQNATSGLTLSMTGLTLGASDTTAFSTDDRTAYLGASYQRIRTVQSDIVALWMLNETSGTTADNAQGTATYDGTYTGGFTLNQSGPASGIASVALNGSSGYVPVSYNAALNPSTATVEMWVRWTSGAGGLVSSYNGGTGDGYVLNVSASGQLTGTFGGGGGSTSFSSTYSLVASAWTHIVLTYSVTDKTIRLYANGSLVSTHTRGSTVASNSSSAFWIGRSSGGFDSGYFNGRIGPVSLFNTAKGAADISALYSASAATSTLGAYAYLDASSARWSGLGTGSETFVLASSGLTTGSKLNVTYRDARI